MTTTRDAQSTLGTVENRPENPERRFLTIVFVDLVGYTELSERLDAEDLGMLQSRYQKLALTIMERYGGFVARFAGDGILVYFGFPHAHERDAERAVRAALELQRRMIEIDTEVQGKRLPALSARIGVHSGHVLMAPEQLSFGTGVPGAVGDVANLAARLQTEAPPGGILMSQETMELVDGLIECEALGSRPIKGLSREVAVFRAVSVLRDTGQKSARQQRGATRMVGRDASVKRILTRWQSTLEGSFCQCVAVVGEAGVGKTRLVLEFCGLPEVADATLLQANCHEIFARTPLFPVGSFFWARAGLTHEDSEPECAQKLSVLLEGLGLHSSENMEIVASLVGLSEAGATAAIAPTPQMFKRKQYEFVLSVIARIAREKPTILWIEDAHWLDPSSAELLLEVCATLKDTPILVLLTMRAFPPGPTLPEVVEAVQLEQLGLQECLELARTVPGAEILADDIVADAVIAADGVPLFLEQLVISLLDERLEIPGKVRRQAGMPLMLAQMMSERLDRLKGGRRIVQAAACIGRSFTPDFLFAVLQETAVIVAEPLEALVNAEILLAKPYGEEVRFEFCHALLQRMAYESMVQTERRAMHGRIVAVLRERAGVRPAIPEVMAHHLTEAGVFAEAAEAWLLAGATANQRSAHVEAVGHLRKGLGLLDRISVPEQRRELELKLQVSLMSSILATQSATSRELSVCCERGLEICQDGEPTPLIFPFVFGKFTFANCRGNSEEAEQIARLFLSLAERSSNESARVIGHRMLGMVLFAQGQATKAKEHLETSLNLYRPERDEATTHMFGQNTEVHTKSVLSLTQFCLGNVDAALDMGIDALRTADAIRHPHSTGIPLCYVGGWVFGLCEATDNLMHESRRLLTLAEQHRLAGFRAHGLAFLGWAMCQRGALAQGIAAIEQGIAAFDSVEFLLALAGHLANLADAQRRVGRMGAAKSSAARAVELLPAGSRWLEAEVRRIEALVVRDSAPEDADRAEMMLRSAVASARNCAFPVMERRCLLSLNKPLDHNVANRTLKRAWQIWRISKTLDGGLH